MKAVSPVLPLRKTHSPAAERSLGGVSRSKSAADDPLSLLCDMNDYYSRLKELVPSLPQNRSVSKMEILQHVIDYILDLQIALDSSSSTPQQQQQQQQELPPSPPQQQQQQHPGVHTGFCPSSNFMTDITSDDHITISR